LTPVKLTALFISRKRTICISSIHGLLCIELSYVYFRYVVCIVLLCVYCCLTYFSCRSAGYKTVSGKFCYQPPRHRFFLVSLCL